MQPFPSLPDAPEDAAQSAQFEHRYDDLTQHGHIKLSALPLVLNRVCFDKIWTRHPLFETRRQGVFPILSRLVLEADPVPVSFTAPLDGRGRIQLAHERDVDNNVSALFMNTYGEIWGLRSRRQAGSESHRYLSARPSVDGDRTASAAPVQREQVRVGRAFGEHVLTKPFGPAAERKLRSFDVPGQPTVPSAVHTRISPLEAMALPPDAQPLDADFIADDATWVFGLTHTDANQHVNSLVYVRCFEEAALRRLAQHGHDLDLLGKRIEINYRKPCFAGDRMVCMLRSHACDGELGVTGYLAPQGVGKERSHCSFRLQLRKVQS